MRVFTIPPYGVIVTYLCITGVCITIAHVLFHVHTLSDIAMLTSASLTTGLLFCLMCCPGTPAMTCNYLVLVAAVLGLAVPMYTVATLSVWDISLAEIVTSG